jgi:uncharacterized membrane protein
MPKGSSKVSSDNKDIAYFLTYLLLWITGLIVYFTKAHDDKKAKFHAIQAILLGLISAIISIIILPFLPVIWILSFLIWIYGLYIGYLAYNGKPANIPYISGFAQSHSDYNNTISTTSSKTKHQELTKSSTEALEALKLRYVKGELSKKKYNEMKKELEG